MQIEQIEILEFLKQHLPFSALEEEAQIEIAQAIDVSYFRAGTQILEYNNPQEGLYLIRSGAVETLRRNGELYNRLAEGSFFGEHGLLRGNKVRFPARAIADTLIYRIPAEIFQKVFDSDDTFADYVEVGEPQRRSSRKVRRDANELMTSRVSSLLSREHVTIASYASVQEAAIVMNQESVSCLLVLDSESQGNEPRLAGIVTDRDIRSRLVATGQSSGMPVGNIMTHDIVTVDSQQYVFEAMMVMLRHNLHHLPVLRSGKPIGVVALPDIVKYESQNSLFVVSNIFQQTTPEALAQLRGDVRACFLRMVNEDANSHMIGASMAAIGRSFKQRLLELAEEKLGPPPVPYCFVALGSMARDEQLIVTDQDNALILDDAFDPASHDEYFDQLAHFVSDGLDACGYSYCKGKVMGTNRKWRQPLRVWRQYFLEWMQQPSPQRLLESNIFFDIDAVWGKTQWVDELNQMVRAQARKHPRFLASMTRNALRRTPPLGFFQEFVMEYDGKQNKVLDIKRRGTAPLVDLIRVHALAVGSLAQNSFERLRDITKADILPPGRGADLQDALEVISMARVRSHAHALLEGDEPDNHVLPDRLSELERKHLRHAFEIVRDAQRFMKFHYNA